MDTQTEVEQPLSVADARRMRREMESKMALSESERLKRARFGASPVCDSCHRAIEKVEDASLITGAPDVRQLLIHNTCWLTTLQSMALKANGMRRGR